MATTPDRLLKDASEALRSSESRYRRLFESARDGILLLNADTAQIEDVNPYLIEMLGYSHAEFLGKKLWEVGAFADITQSKEMFQVLQEKGYVRYENLPLRTISGERIAVEFVSNSYECDGIKVIQCNVRNISERIEHDRVLREFKAIVDASDDAIISKSLNGIIKSWNPGAERLFGYTSGEAIGSFLSIIIPSNRLHEETDILARLSRGERIEHFETVRRHKDGRLFDISATISPIRDGRDKVVGASKIARNITERKQAEALISKGARRLEIALDGSQISVWETDLRTNEVWLDAAWATFLGHVPAETRTTAAALLTQVHPEDRQTVASAAVQTMKGEISTYAIDHRVKSAAGEWKWIHSRGTVIERDVAGLPLRMSGTNTDITARKQAETAHVALESQLRESQKMQAIGTLAGGIAHDFNNALATILGNVDLARQDAAGNLLVLESLDEIRKAGTRARNLVQQILSFSRQQPTARTSIDVAALVLGAARMLRATLPARLSLNVHCARDVPSILADASQIEQILINLATNAMQAMRSGPGRIDIRLDTVMLDATLSAAQPALKDLYARHPGSTIRLTVSDTGTGMDEATRKRIFEPFFTTKPTGEGTGLGLSVVHGILKTHGGEIIVESDSKKGTTFTIYLPMAPKNPPEFTASTATSAPAPGLTGGLHVLYVDDDEALLFLLQRLLERRGYRVSAFIEPQAALRALSTDPAAFDLLLTDYNMPEMSGLDVAREARAIRADLPVAVTSGFIDETLRKEAEGAGVSQLIFKADEVEVFCDAVQRLAQTVQQGAKTY